MLMPVGYERRLFYVSIGNSDDKLKQERWREFIEDLISIVSRVQVEIHGVWFSEPVSPYQNMCIAFMTTEELIPELLLELSRLTEKYDQESILLAQAIARHIVPGMR